MSGLPMIDGSTTVTVIDGDERFRPEAAQLCRASEAIERHSADDHPEDRGLITAPFGCASHRQARSIMAFDRKRHHGTLRLARHRYRQEMLRPSLRRALDQNLARRAGLCR